MPAIDPGSLQRSRSLTAQAELSPKLQPAQNGGKKKHRLLPVPEKIKFLIDEAQWAV
jgi:hypothetical protein